MIDSKMWAGLNRTDIDIKSSDVVIFGIPFEGGVTFRSGTKEAPNALRDITYTITPTTEDFIDFSSVKIKDLGNMDGNTREEVFNKATSVTEEIVKNKKFFIMIGGDHSVTIPVHAGINNSLGEEFGIIHIDAHFDLCDSLNGDRLSHGSTERRALELENVKDTDSLFFLGIRSIEMDELEFYNKNKINVLTAKDISKLGTDECIRKVKEKMKKFKHIYLTVDIDSLDPGFAGGTGTPQFGGITPRELLNLLEGIFELNIIGMDVVEVAPKLDDSLASLFAARKIITECIGFQYKKGLFNK